LNERASLLHKTNGDYQRILECHPYIEGIIYAADHMQIKALNDFKNVMTNYFGCEVYDNSQKMLNVEKYYLG
jgi:hypothetical protein